MKELSTELSRVIEAETGQRGRAPTIAELAATTGAEEDEVIEALQLEAYSTLLALPAARQPGRRGDQMQDMLGSDDEGFSEVEDSALVEAGLEALDQRERLIVELRFFEGLTSRISRRGSVSPRCTSAAAAQGAPHDARTTRGLDPGERHMSPM